MPFKWRGKYLCFYCGIDFQNYSLLKEHTRNHGKCSDRDRAIRLVKSPDSEIKIDVSVVTCNICEKSFPSLPDIIGHLTSKHKLPFNTEVELMITPYRLVDLSCLQCNKSFAHFNKLVTHMNKIHPVNCFLCQKCDQKFNKKRDLDAHVRTHHKKDYVCNKCGQQFPSHSALLNHRFNSHFSSCSICFKTFPTLNKRLRHMRLEHTPDQTECGYCLKGFSTKQALLRHTAQCDGNDSKRNDIADDKRQSVQDLRNGIASIINMSTAIPFKFFMNRFRCFYCTEDFLKCDELKEHTIQTHPLCDTSLKSMQLRNRYDGVQIKFDISSLSCKLCHENFNDLDILLEHFSAEHKTRFDSSVVSNIQPFKLIKDNFKCPYCTEVFRYFGLLLKHVSVTHTDNKHVCVHCGKSFRTDPNLRAHVHRRHNDAGRRYKCKSCDLVFHTRMALKFHMGGAHGSKVVECRKCPEKFTSTYWMQRHMISTHGTGHKCPHCERMFIKNSFMVNHVRRMHLKEKNVECSVCYEKFFDGQRLKMHMVKHVGERNFNCDVCGKRFLWKRNLKGHMAAHVRNANQNNA